MPIFAFCDIDEDPEFPDPDPVLEGLSSIASSSTIFIKLSKPRRVPETFLPLFK